MRLVDNNMNIDIRIQNGPNPLKISQLGQEKKIDYRKKYLILISNSVQSNHIKFLKRNVKKRN